MSPKWKPAAWLQARRSDGRAEILLNENTQQKETKDGSYTNQVYVYVMTCMTKSSALLPCTRLA